MDDRRKSSGDYAGGGSSTDTEYIVVTVIVSGFGRQRMGIVKSAEDVKAALRIIGSLPEENLQVCHGLFTRVLGIYTTQNNRVRVYVCIALSLSPPSPSLFFFLVTVLRQSMSFGRLKKRVKSILNEKCYRTSHHSLPCRIEPYDNFSSVGRMLCLRR